MQLKTAGITVAIIIAASGTALADGEINARAAYYKEDATRVIQPMIDARLDVAGGDGELRPHMLVDAITSASAASGAVPGVAFTERRYEVGARYLHNLSHLFRVGGSLRFSDEPDYTSVYIGATGAADLAQRNTTLTVAGYLGSDEMDNSGGQGDLSSILQEEMQTYIASFGISQVLTPQIVAGITYDVNYVRGFQGNMYRTVTAGGVQERERVPRKRVRNAVFASVRAFLPWTKTMIAPGYRYYRDSWDVVSHTPEVRIAQQLLTGVDLHGRYRYYRQTAAEFYKEIYDSNDPDMEPYLTNDPKLDAYRSHWFTLKLDLAFSALGLRGNLGRARADVAVTYIRTTSKFGNAITGQLAFSYPFDY